MKTDFRRALNYLGRRFWEQSQVGYQDFIALTEPEWTDELEQYFYVMMDKNAGEIV